ncbi:MAG TPA: hypothetical protein PKJ37_02370 [Acidobacteriota bacterium]|nr:hypothetical protein [Acidobacteriota bacterium]
MENEKDMPVEPSQPTSEPTPQIRPGEGQPLTKSDNPEMPATPLTPTPSPLRPGEGKLITEQKSPSIPGVPPTMGAAPIRPGESATIEFAAGGEAKGNEAHGIVTIDSGEE